MDTVLSCNDCDDDDDGNFPGNTELCDGQDNDCNGLADFNDGPVGDDDDSAGPSMDSTELDIDGDGYLECDDDCDDDSVDFAPDAPELCDGFDNNYDGLVPGDEADADADTWLECAGDCDDTNADANPDAPEASADACTDGFDNDCDGDTDEDDSDCDGLLGDDDDSAGDDDARARLGHCNCSAASSAGNVGAGLLLLGLLGLVRRRQL
jgi:MYXO-CTERM domain-containing protein